MRVRAKLGVAVEFWAAALEQEPACLAHVEAVRDGADPLTLAKLYANGARRRTDVGRLLELAADDPAGDYLLADAGDLLAFAIPPDGPGRPTTYRLRVAFTNVVWTGARATARRGAHKCLECGAALCGGATSPHGRSVRRDFCAAHEHLPEPVEAIRQAFDYLHTALHAQERY